MQTLLRLGGWGFAAAIALVLAVAAAYSSAGQQRLAALTGKITPQVATTETNPTAPDPEQLARLLATELETQRLLEMVRSLAFDRERMMTRLAALERNLEDVTGSIRKQAAAPPAAPPAVPPVLAPPPATAAPQPLPSPAETIAAPAPVKAPERIANVALTSENTEPESAQRSDIGVDLGGAANFDGLRALWQSVTTANAGLFEGMHPIVIVRENSRTRAADLRLVAGPLEDDEAAARICAALNATKRYCRPMAFEGQPLALAAPEPPPRPKAVRRKPAEPRPPGNVMRPPGTP